MPLNNVEVSSSPLKRQKNKQNLRILMTLISLEKKILLVKIIKYKLSNELKNCLLIIASDVTSSWKASEYVLHATYFESMIDSYRS